MKLYLTYIHDAGRFTLLGVFSTREAAESVYACVKPEVTEAELDVANVPEFWQPRANRNLCAALPFPASLDDCNWAEVFGEGTGGNCTTIIPDAPLGSDVSTAHFGRADVAEIRGLEEGEHDGANWIVWGKLKDGRFFVARGGCDYTGWDCRASNSGNVAATEEDIKRFGMDEDERERFKCRLPEDVPIV